MSLTLPRVRDTVCVEFQTSSLCLLGFACAFPVTFYLMGELTMPDMCKCAQISVACMWHEHGQNRKGKG